MIKIIVVGVDGGEPSMRAARRAAELAAQTGAALHVLTAVDQGRVEEYAGRPGAAQLTSGEVAEGVAREAALALGDLVADVSSAVVQGKPAAALVDEATRLGADVIVVGNRRVQGIGRVLGSVASAVAAHAPCDVYIVRTV